MKKFLSLLATLGLLLSFGCSKKDENTEEDPKKEESSETGDKKEESSK